MLRTSPILVSWILVLGPACLEDKGQVLPTTTVTEVPDTAPTGSGTQVAAVDSTPAQETVIPPGGLVVHEWGTFTSQQSPDGVSQPGLHHEDEPLPGFVFQRDFKGSTYYSETLPEEPLQQLETPVVYFYSQAARDVHFHVAFPEGLVTQWFPYAGSYAPALGAIARVGDGAMDWDVRVDPAIAASSFPAVDPEEIWAPARRVASTPISVKVGPLPAARAVGMPEPAETEHEQFIFYRGLGHFDLPVRVVTTDTQLTITNLSSDPISDVFLLHVDAKNLGGLRALGRLGPGESRVESLPLTVGGAEWLGPAQGAMRSALEATGLYADEAAAMVATWTRSWFGNHGLRVLYVVPRAWTDRLLPLAIEPVPDALVRTLVGRIEVMTPGDVRSAYEQVMEGAASEDWAVRSEVITQLGRFAEPRIRYLLSDPAFGLALNPGANELLQMAHDQW